MYSNFDYYDYKGKFSFPSFHFRRNNRKLLENPRNHPESILLDIKVLFILA